jgi:hypothetical protein
MLHTRIEELDLTVRAYNVLKKNKLLTVKDIIEFGTNNIIGLKNAGRRTVKEVLDTILPYIQTGNIPSPNKDYQSPPEDVNTTFPDNHFTFEELIKRTFNKDLINTPVDELDISVRAMGALKNAGCKTIEDIVNFGLTNLRALRNVGRKTIEEIKNAIQMCNRGEVHDINEINFIDTTNLILGSLPPKYLEIIKARYGYKDGRVKTLEGIGYEKGITRERVRQITEKVNNQIRRKGKILQPLIEATERLLHKYNGIISAKDMAGDKYFESGTHNQLTFLTNLLADLYKERYRIINKNFLTSLNDNEIKILHDNIRKAALACRFPVGKKTFTQRIISAVGTLSEKYLIHHLVQKDRIEIVEGRVVSPGKLSISQKIKVLLKGVNRPMHYTEIATLYRSHFGDAKIKASDLEHALHARIGDSKDFILVNRGTFVPREKFNVPNNIEEIVDKAKVILQKLKTISDTRYLINQLKNQKVDIGNLNEYSLKSILLEHPGFVSYKKFAIGIEEFADKYEQKYLRDLIRETLLLSSEPWHLKKILVEIHKKRGFRDYVVAKCLHDDPEFIRIDTSTYTVKEKIDMYNEKQNKIIGFAKEWIKLKGNPVSAFFVCEVLKEAEELEDLPLGLVESVLATSPEFIKLPNGFYDLACKKEESRISP